MLKEKETTTVSIRIDKDLKAKSERLFDELGLNISSAFTIFLKQSVRENGLPFAVNLNVPNAATLKAMEDARRISRDPSAKTYTSFEDVVKELDD